MGREALIEMDCSRYSNRIIDIINLLNECGWKYYNNKKMVEYLPLGDIDSFNWQDDFFSESELQELINKKQSRLEMVGLNLFYENSWEGVTLLASSTKKILLNVCLLTEKHLILLTLFPFYGKISAKISAKQNHFPCRFMK